MFLLPGLVMGSYVCEMPITEHERIEIIRYLINLAHPDDGGWGLYVFIFSHFLCSLFGRHIESHSTAFGTVMNYVVLRLLGMPPEHPVAAKARRLIHKLGGAVCVPSWGKFWLSVLNLYSWEGNNPMPPELWCVLDAYTVVIDNSRLLPDWVPIHPHRWWIHTRNIYIPMSYLYSFRYQIPTNDLILALRSELYLKPYDEIDWPAQRLNVHPIDVYAPHTAVLKVLFSILSLYEKVAIPGLREAAQRKVLELCAMEDENTGYQDIAPVSKMINAIVRMHAEGKGKAWRRHMETRDDFMWIGETGMRMSGTNGSQTWDTAFMAQAFVETGLAREPEFRRVVEGVHRWMAQAQMTDNPKHFREAYRQGTKGAWGFSTTTQSYLVTDCTGEGMKAVMYLQKHLECVHQKARRILLSFAVACLSWFLTAICMTRWILCYLCKMLVADLPVTSAFARPSYWN